jgi:hypothetical protein
VRSGQGRGPLCAHGSCVVRPVKLGHEGLARQTELTNTELPFLHLWAHGSRGWSRARQSAEQPCAHASSASMWRPPPLRRRLPPSPPLRPHPGLDDHPGVDYARPLMCSPRGRPPRPASKSAPERACTTVMIGTWACGSSSEEEDMFSVCAGVAGSQRVCHFRLSCLIAKDSCKLHRYTRARGFLKSLRVKTRWPAAGAAVRNVPEHRSGPHRSERSRGTASLD